MGRKFSSTAKLVCWYAVALSWILKTALTARALFEILTCNELASDGAGNIRLMRRK